MSITLKVLSWNTWANCDFAKVVEFLRASNADIISLQEVMVDDSTRDIVQYLANIGYDYVVGPWGKVAYYGGRTMANAVFTKHSIRATRVHELPAGEKRVAVEADITVRGTLIHAASLHLLHVHQQESLVQNLQAETLVRILPRKHVIVMGDFNATPNMTPIMRMRKLLTDTDPASTPTLNAPLFDCPNCEGQALDKIRLNYIFVSKDLTASSFKVEGGKGSDHFPISVRVEV